ncbi:MAG: galactokinase [Spirochaetia bacterium]|nr:galactokinase [Spirochaetia bacterium]
MSELRYNPMLGTYTMVASGRQHRPHMDPGKCPFCPGQGKLGDYDVLKYDNDFPVLSQNPQPVKGPKSKVYSAAEAYGKCEVILYSSNHKTNLYELPLQQINKIVDLWVERQNELSKDKRIKYVFQFENKGEEVGVTMFHPHGQIYAYPFVPLKIKTELDNARAYSAKNGGCMVCDMNAEESSEGTRVIYENDSFMVYLPYFTDYPYGVFISSKEHRPYLTSLSAEEKTGLADALKVVEGTFDKVYNRPFPFMMCVHQCPMNSPEYKTSQKNYHLHIEFYTPLRGKDRIKFYASSESGAWAAANVMEVEQSAKVLVSSKMKYFAQSDRERFKTELKKEFVKAHGGKADGIRVFSAPARVNIIGEHIDYNGGLVMPAGLTISFFAALRERNDKRIVLKSLDMPGTAIYTAGKKPGHNDEYTWANYPAGVMDALLEKGRKINIGFDVLFFSEVPVGAGVSSSAAFEVVFGYALSRMCGFDLSKKEAALIGKAAENNFVGVKCGIMDQYASAMAEAGKAILLDCAKVESTYIPADFGDYRIVVSDTNKKRELSGSKYNERLAECRTGLAILRKRVKIKNLCDLDEKKLKPLLRLLKDPVIKKRVMHVVSENERVKRAEVALKAGDIKLLGKLLNQSHMSLKNDYEVTGEELDAMFEEAIKAPGCTGSRMTGAGFGGCTISLVHKNSMHDFEEKVAAGYKKRTGRIADFYVCEAGDGVREI